MNTVNTPSTEKIRSFTDLNAWKQAHKLVIMVYGMTKKFPSDEIFGLTNQLRRAIVSVSSNIAEGFTRRSSKEKVQFYSTGLSSLTESQNQFLVARDVGYISKDDFMLFANQSVVVSKLINGLIKGVKNVHYPISATIHNS